MICKGHITMSLEGVGMEAGEGRGGREGQKERGGDRGRRRGRGREGINTCVMLRWNALKLLVIFPSCLEYAELQLVLLFVRVVREHIL